MEPSVPQLFALVPLASCVLCAAFGLTALARDPGHRLHRASALLLFAVAYWAFFEFVTLSAPNAEAAFVAVLLSTPGWVLVAPLTVNLASAAMERGEKQLLRRLTPWLFAIGTTLTLLNWSRHSLSSRVVETPWGYTFEAGPMFPLHSLLTLSCVGLAFLKWLRRHRDLAIAGGRRADGSAPLGLLSPIVFACFSDAILPMLGIQAPRIGTASFTLLALLLLVSHLRLGYSFAAPEGFARKVLETLPDGVASLDRDGRIRFANEGLERCVGLDARELVGVPFARFIRESELALDSDLRSVECEFGKPDGERVPVSISSSSIRDRKGDLLGRLVVIREMGEVTTLRRRLVTSGRLAAVGQLAAGIAHEINNPLAFVRANLSVLRGHWQTLVKALDEGIEPASAGEIISDGEEIIDESLEGVDRAAGIIRDVREFSHAGGHEREWADLNQLLDRVTRVATPGLSPAIRIERQYGEIPLVLSSPQQLKQVFLNLIVNALHAVGEAGTLRLRTEVEGDEVLVRVEDDGCGIPADIVERIFDPFFTTKAVGKGTGLGLSISYEIVRSHNGEISVEPKTGPGTRICVRLPIGTEDEATQPATSHSSGEP